MGVSRENLFIILMAVVAVLLQLMLSPYIIIANCAPNIIAAYVVVVAVVRPSSHRVAPLSFILGLCYNLFQGGPVGAMALVLLVVAFLAGRLMALLDNDTKFMPVVLAIIGLLVVELAYGIITIAMGLDSGFIEVLSQRVLPCTVYDAIFIVIWYFIMSKLASEASTDIPPLGGPTLLR